MEKVLDDLCGRLLTRVEPADAVRTTVVPKPFSSVRWTATGKLSCSAIMESAAWMSPYGYTNADSVT